jgi:hypothetical protein
MAIHQPTLEWQPSCTALSVPMTHILRAFIHYSHDIVAHHFFWIWTVALIFVALGSFLFNEYRATLLHSVPSGLPRLPERFTGRDVLAAAAFLLFAAAYVGVILYHADFATYDDNDVFTDYSVRGIPYGPVIWIPAGRFYPLAFQEFNLLSHVTHSALGYHLLGVLQLVVLLFVLFFALEKFQIRFRFLIMAALMLTPSFLISFSGLIFPERNILFLLAIVLLCLQRYADSNGNVYFVGCMVATYFLLFYKEIVVILVAVFAISHLFLQIFTDPRESRRSWNYWREIALNNPSPIGMLVLCAIYSALFFLALLPIRGSSYVASQHGRFEGMGVVQPLLFWQFIIDWLPLALLVIFIFRVARFLFSRDLLDPLLDPLAAAALAYYFCIIALRIGNGWYTAPVDFISIIYLASTLAASIKRGSALRASVVALVLVAIATHDVLYSSFEVVERKSVITAKAQLAGFLKNYLSNAKTGTLELYFPYAYGYDLMGFSAYLRNLGFNIDGPFIRASSNPGSPHQPIFFMEGRREFPNEKCVDYRAYVCRHADSPPRGALIVVMPDDNASASDLERISSAATRVWTWKGPGFCTRANSWFRSMHAISRTYPRTRLPEHWLQLDVFKAPG